jgi:NAD(P)-dependent dehydrogenase (short-subunit alcohol dehydrogenase family)
MIDWIKTHPLEGKVAVVTGASRSTGKAIACVLGEAGATVYVTGRSTRGHTLLREYPLDDSRYRRRSYTKRR